MHRLLTKITFLFLLFSGAASAQNRVRLRSGDVDVPELTDALADSLNRVLPRSGGRAYLLLQLDRVPDAADRKRLTAAGVELEQYLSGLSYTAAVSGPLSRAGLRPLGVRGAWAFRPEQKIDPALLAPQLPAWATRAAGTVNVLVRVPKSMMVSAAVATFLAAGHKVTTLEWSRWHVVGLQVSLQQLKALALLPEVDYVQAEPPQAAPLNYPSRAGAHATLLDAPLSAGGRALTGAGVVVGVGDDGDPQFHVDFRGRVIARAYGHYSNHGVHVAGTVAGAGIVQEEYRGYAPQATLVSQTGSFILTNAERYHQDYGMVLTNNSYGNIIECAYNGTYDIYAQLIDEQAFDIPDLLHVFAAGNSGGATCSPFPQRYHTVLGGWQSAKNVVTVGATSDSGLVAGFSSRGPVRDGRIKPEVMATGVAVNSTIYGGLGNTYNTNQGTSMAAPAVTGGLALLVERYRQLNGGANPQGALLKAVLCNGAADRGITGPDFNYGYGWMNLQRSADMIENGHVLSGTATQGNTNTHTVAVPANTAQLKVLLYWHDPAASLIAAKALVNDLDLEVVDLSNNTVLPYRLDTSYGSLGTAAFTGADHLNNLEQVVIDNPPAGNYTIRVKGTAITQNAAQAYFVAWDPVPVALQIVNPVGGEAWIPGEDMKLTWDASGNPASTYALSYSVDSGANWTPIAAGLAADRRIYSWTVPTAATAGARVRVTQEGTGATSTSANFVILTRPVITTAASSNQCEGYYVFSWSAVSGATDYEVLQLRGSGLVTIATTTGTSYTVEGLSRDTAYWFSVRPRINGAYGRRAVAKTYQPNTGSCSGSVSNNDLKLSAITAPLTRRQNTAAALTAATPVQVLIRNLDDVASTAGFDVKYQVNGGAWVTETVNATIAAQGSYTHAFATTANLAAAGTYTITAVVKHASTDTHVANDTAVRVLRQLVNAPLTLPFTDNLEGLGAGTYDADTVGLPGGDRYDYQHASTSARLRTVPGSGFTRSGSRAFTLDQARGDSVGFVNTGGSQYVVATFNLAAFDTATNDLRLDFALMRHGDLNGTNKVWIRGNSGTWIEALDLSTLTGETGTYSVTPAIEITRLLRAARQNFTDSFQVKWGQSGKYPASDPGFLDGYSIDDIRLYEAANDIQVRAILNPREHNCGLSNHTPVTVQVRNSALTAQTNIPVAYRIGNGSWVTETIASLGAGAVTDYTFTATADLSAFGSQRISARVQQSGDNVELNDTLSTVVQNSPVISSFPYTEGFESSSGNWYAGGKNASWQWGAPASQSLTRAASGSKAWKTGIAGNYNDNEYSYLYSPCFNISALTAPTLSFALALDIEDCNPYICDAAWVEYSVDGISWTKLGTNGSGTNWYNRGGGLDVWSRQNYLTWRVATIALPAVAATELRIRFVMYSDAGVSRQGVAIDDIHVYDNVSMFTGPTAAPVTQAVSGNSWVHINTPGGKRLVSIHPAGQDLGQLAVQAYVDTSSVRCTNFQYYLGRSYTIKQQTRSPFDSVTVRLYFSEREAEQVLNATSCYSASRPSTAFDFGVSKYTDADTSLEDNSLLNNVSGNWYFYGSAARSIVPYDQGYYAEFKVKSFSEFWFNSGGPTNTSPLPVRFVQFTARRQDRDALLAWEVAAEEDVEQYDVEVAAGAAELQEGRFLRIGSVAAAGNTSSGGHYAYTDTRPGKSGTLYYRLRVRNRDGSVQFSAVRPVTFGAAFTTSVYPNPSTGVFFVSYSAPEGAAVQLRLLDAQGRVLQRWSRGGTGFMEKIALDLQGPRYPPGMYLLQAETGGEVHTLRLFRK
ncbi:T9SS type A sorting domain-containing protein [Flaviaesturariibacter flavus]|uniref:T9SS type A sorting domain-containing protein n=1 Tax=Flaviaesturariibacter flavus TaxID=2502780 RepID=A0A4R1BBK7_9BACT|nr:S8 family serine peptidase [Flaviaesturariibacter flavus]TCJ14318.1 T9SS type A sorting domain-containing protein [Flaviaesturariibacter flavus]